MGEIFLDTLRREGGFEKLVAVNRIVPHLADDPSFVRMFEEEARLCALLNHESIIHVYDFGYVDGEAFLAMELVDGFDLRTLLGASCFLLDLLSDEKRPLPERGGLGLPPGAYRVLCTAPGQEPFRRDLTLRAAETATVRVETPAAATRPCDVELRTEPPGASITLDGNAFPQLLLEFGDPLLECLLTRRRPRPRQRRIRALEQLLLPRVGRPSQTGARVRRGPRACCSASRGSPSRGLRAASSREPRFALRSPPCDQAVACGAPSAAGAQSRSPTIVGSRLRAPGYGRLPQRCLPRTTPGPPLHPLGARPGGP